ncbi:hypothetical protein KCP75_10780 [Salmonella enterica subsp. enterica]|nr:hypothetical protein KCP75_10780 [Salmonella enterica subsp. enterica]
MQHQRAGCLDNRAVKIVEIAKQIAIQENSAILAIADARGVCFITCG